MARQVSMGVVTATTPFPEIKIPDNPNPIVIPQQVPSLPSELVATNDIKINDVVVKRTKPNRKGVITSITRAGSRILQVWVNWFGRNASFPYEVGDLLKVEDPR